MPEPVNCAWRQRAFKKRLEELKLSRGKTSWDRISGDGDAGMTEDELYELLKGLLEQAAQSGMGADKIRSCLERFVPTKTNDDTDRINGYERACEELADTISPILFSGSSLKLEQISEVVIRVRDRIYTMRDTAHYSRKK